jgi:hypothetical protein
MALQKEKGIRQEGSSMAWQRAWWMGEVMGRFWTLVMSTGSTISETYCIIEQKAHTTYLACLQITNFKTVPCWWVRKGGEIVIRIRDSY